MEKYYGLAGKILRVNLTTGLVTKEEPDVALFKKYLGGRGVGNAMLARELPVGIDPLGPENKLIFMTGPVAGTMSPGCNKMTVSFKSLATNTISWSLCGGHLAPEIKFAGYDGIIIEGKSETPVYLWVNNNTVELRDASKWWGTTTHIVEDGIREELSEPDAKLALIGPAGENLVRFACIQSDYHREFGRGGCGAVMGSKNLKAIAVRGVGSLTVADPAGVAAAAEEVYGILANHPKAQARRKFGTIEMVDGINKLGFWSIRNFTGGQFEAADQLNHDSFKKAYVTGDISCYGCPVACGKNSEIKTGVFAGTKIEGPEYESLSLLGSNCGLQSYEEIIKATDICDIYGMDTITAGATLAMAMEAYEKGIISKKDTYGLDLKFGNGEAAIKMLQKIAVRADGLASLLAEGSKRAAEALGVPELAMQSKGLEFAAYDPRGSKGMALTYATSAKGAHHMVSPTMGAEIAGDRFASVGKATLVADTQKFMAIVDSMALCASMRFALDLAKQMNFYSKVTGFEVSAADGMIAGERILNLERAFNAREGFSRKNDTLPKRMTDEAMQSGPSQGQTIPLQEMLDEFYGVMGWDNEGIPTAETLERLEIKI